MGVREEVFEMLKNGMQPVEIAKARNVTLKTIVGYLDELVGRGWLRRSDILFTIPADIRIPIIDLYSRDHNLHEYLIVTRLQKEKGITVDNDVVKVVIKYYDQKHALGDIYEDIRTIEVGLHEFIRTCLENEYGKGESGWWRNGIPLEIRRKCQDRREEDEDGVESDPYCYTDLIDLKTILDKRWNILKENLSKEIANDRNKFLQDLDRLNRIRRMVMHPVRGGIPTQEDFDFLHKLKEKLGFL